VIRSLNEDGSESCVMDSEGNIDGEPLLSSTIYVSVPRRLLCQMRLMVSWLGNVVAGQRMSQVLCIILLTPRARGG